MRNINSVAVERDDVAGGIRRHHDARLIARQEYHNSFRYIERHWGNKSSIASIMKTRDILTREDKRKKRKCVRSSMQILVTGEINSTPNSKGSNVK